jgi:hypothetical protein
MTQNSRAGFPLSQPSGMRDHPAQEGSPARGASYEETAFPPQTPLRYSPGAFALVTITSLAFEVSGVTMDKQVAEEWVAENPALRRYTDVLVFSYDRQGESD